MTAVIESTRNNKTEVFNGVYLTAGKFDCIPTSKNVLRYAFVWDMIPYVAPNLVRGKNDFLKLIKNDPAIFDFYFVDSLSAKKDLISVTGVSEEKVFVSHLGSSDQIHSATSNETVGIVLNKYCLRNNQYIFSVSAYEKRKNFERMIVAFIRSIKKIGRDELKYVIVGNRQEKLKKSLKDLIEKGVISKEDVEKHVLLLGYLSSSEVSIISKNSLFMAYVSLYEGFGLPALDAMKNGIPVLTANVSSLPEVVGDAALTVNPYSVEDISEAMIQLIEDDVLRESLIKKGRERERLFTWDACVERMVENFKIKWGEIK